MKIVIIQQEIHRNLLDVIVARFQDGGFAIMMLILLGGIISIVLFISGIYYLKNLDPRIEKMITVINSIGLFSLVLGVFGQLIKLIHTLDYLSVIEDISPRDFANGLKFSMLPTLFGTLVLLLTRFFTIVLNFIKPAISTKH